MNSTRHPPFPIPPRIPDSIQFQSPSPNPNPNPNPKPSPDPTLSDALSSISSLVSLSEHTLTALSNAFPDLVDPRKGQLDNESCIPCPFDPRHVVPLEGLFRHHLSCHTPLGSNSTMIWLPNYCKTLGLRDEGGRRKDGFVERVGDGDGDGDGQFLFGVDEYLCDSGRNFFYEGCPGVVSSSFSGNGDGAGSGRMFSLPGVVSVECADVVPASDDVAGEGIVNDDRRLSEHGIFPSGYWRVRMELEGWVDYPSSYSSDMLNVILVLRKLDMGSFRRYLIGKSPQYGVIVDGAMAGHMLVLFRLCVKAIMWEGVSLAKDIAVKGNIRSEEEFPCPHLVIVMTWLASQFSILYGDLNGKLFSIDLFKKCIGEVASSIVMYKHVDSTSNTSNDIACAEDTVSDGCNGKGGDEGSKMKEIQSDVDYSKLIYGSQVVAAVAALHERSLLEGKIRGSLHSVQLSSYQRVIEHANITNRANGERMKRLDYKPIIDHDGLPRLSASAQEANKTKTIEELLAEERDYKRRRMSYRGKKSKRNPSEVLRGIIEGYMEEINQAGGIGCFEKSADIIPVNSSSNLSNEREGQSDYHLRPSSADCEVISSSSLQDRNSPKNWKSIHHNEHFNYEAERCDEVKQGRKHDPYNPERSRLQYSREHSSRLSEGRDGTGLKSGRKWSGSGQSKYEGHKSTSRRGEDSSYWKSEHKEKRLSTHGKHGSEFPVENGFEDRYDPSQSDDFVY